MNQRYTDSVGVRLILIFFATVLLVRVHGQDGASSICAAEGSWKTNMCAKETDFHGNVTCRERLIVLSEEGEENDVLATIIKLKSELSIVRSQNTELRNRLSRVETTIMPSPPPPSPPPNPPPPPSPPILISIWSAPTGCYNSAENLGRSKCNDASCPDVAWEENSLTSWHESMSLCASVSSVSTSSFRTDGPICGIGGKVDARSHKGNTMSITAIYACDGSGNGFDVPNPSTGTLLQGETNLYEWGCETSASDPWIEVDYTRTTHDKLGGLIFRTQAGISCKIGAHKDNTAGVRELGHCGECAIYSMQLVTIPLGTGLTGVTMDNGGVYGLYFHFSTSPSPSP